MTGTAKVLAISGGVGGAKLALGLANELEPEALAVLVNTADDFRHLGLQICPDIDTLLYTLSGRSNRSLGWGLEGESWQVMKALEELGGETWFRLGDNDLATHLWRTARLAAGESLSSVTRGLAQRMGVKVGILPMSDDSVSTVVHSDEGDLAFQHYFVRRQCEPQVSGFSFRGIEQASPSSELLQLLDSGQVAAVVICPSNPFVSVDPVLQLPGLWQKIAALQVPVVAVSPILAGQAVKGPAAKMLGELGQEVSAEAVMRHYSTHYPGFIDTFVIDQSDAALADQVADLGVSVAVTDTLMKSLDDKRRLARFVLSRAGH
ncbi:2-phospho-L-lactate transferase [Parahaliea sp. F7430]|uniref:2-phospho-L-lactate transferase n=1 Tax=Sediminihaliea albiluteola TaxID=2758564 RepID=A0A7W2YII9_9GAMM|nr:2-phospho-L-lactate transferase [Sediminihaliea albiluteola]MBA6412551.1 2-phospho-L-lactate transferase [Sediminihaliea albiluteola]